MGVHNTSIGDFSVYCTTPCSRADVYVYDVGQEYYSTLDPLLEPSSLGYPDSVRCRNMDVRTRFKCDIT